MAAIAAIFCFRVYVLLKYYWYWEYQFLVLSPVYSAIVGLLAYVFVAKSADNFIRVTSDSLTLLLVSLVMFILAHALGIVLVQSMTDIAFDASNFGGYLFKSVAEISMFLLEPLLIFILAGGAVIAGFVINKSTHLRS